MAIDFPNSPSTNDTYTVGNKTWIYDGTTWNTYNSTTFSAETLPGTTIKSTVTGSSLTSVGTLGSLNVSGDVTVDTSTLKVDATNNRVGVGTSSPQATLDVQATTGTGVRITNTGTGNCLLVEDATGDTAPFVIDQSGNVGMGVSTPAARLHVSDGNANIRMNFSATSSDAFNLTPPTAGANNRSLTLRPAANMGSSNTLDLPNVTGTVISTGNLSSITSVGTLSSLTVDGPNSPSITIGDYSGGTSNSAIESNSGHLVLGSTSPTAIYLRTTNAQPVYIGANQTNLLGVGSTTMSMVNMASPSITFGQWSASSGYSAIETSKGYLLLGATSGNDNVYLRASGASAVVRLGGNASDTLTVGNSDSTFAGTLNGSGVWNNTSDTKASNLWMTNYLIANPGVTSSGQSAQWFTYLGLWYLCRNSSTRTEKENIQSLNGIVTPNMIDDIDVLLWSRKNAVGIPEIGPMAEDMDAISPFLSTRGIKDYDDEGNAIQTEPNGINQNAWLSLITIALQDSRKRIAELENIIRQGLTNGS